MTEPIEIEMSDEEYENYLNDAYGTVNVCGTEYDAGNLLKRIDRIAFDEGKSDLELSQWECFTCGHRYDTNQSAKDCCNDICDNCGNEYDFTDSESVIPDSFCCIKCEEEYYEKEAKEIEEENNEN